MIEKVEIMKGDEDFVIVKKLEEYLTIDYEETKRRFPPKCPKCNSYQEVDPIFSEGFQHACITTGIRVRGFECLKCEIYFQKVPKSESKGKRPDSELKGRNAGK